jgi:hypothetical protein
MPWFTLQRNYALSTTKGQSVNFKKGEKTWVPKGIVQEALAIGAVPDEPLDATLFPDVAATPEKKVIDAAERKNTVFAAFEKLVLRSGRGDFSASGHPHPRKLEEIVGFEMAQREREALWEEYNAKKAEEAEQ